MPFNQPVQRRMGTNRENVKENENIEVRSLHYICIVRNCITTAEKAKPGCSAGSVASGHTVSGSGMGGACLFHGASRTANLIAQKLTCM